MKYFKRFLYALLSVILFITSLLVFLLTSTAGVHTLVKVTNLIIPGTVTVKKVKGRLIDKVFIKKLTYQDSSTDLELNQFTFSWNFKALFHGALELTKIHTDTVSIRTKTEPEAIKKLKQPEKETTSKSPPFTLPSLPVTLSLDQFSIDTLRLLDENATTVIRNIFLKATLNQQTWSIDQFRAHYAQQTLKLTSSLTPHYPYRTFTQLQILSSGPAANTVQGTLKLRGDFSHYEWHGQITGLVTAQIDGFLKESHDLKTTLHWRDVNLLMHQQQRLITPYGTIKIYGSLNNLFMKAQSQIQAPLQANLLIDAHLKNQILQATTNLHLKTGHLLGKIVYNPNRSPALKGNVHAEQLDLSELQIPLKSISMKAQFSGTSLEDLAANATLHATYHKQPLKAQFNFRDQHAKASIAMGANQLKLEGHLPYQWEGTLSIPAPQQLHPALKGLQTTLQGTFLLQGPQKGTLHLEVRPGTYHNRTQSDLPPLRFEGGYVNVLLNRQQLEVQSALTLDRQKTLLLKTTMPKFSLDASDFKAQSFKGQLQLRMNSFEFLNQLSPVITEAQGQLNTHIDASGTLGQPQLTGAIELTQGSITLPSQNLTLNPIQLKLTTEKKKWHLNSQIGSKEKTLTLTGQGEFDPTVRGEIKIHGDTFQVMNTDEYHIFISPDLDIHFTPNAVSVNGTITIPEALIKPLSFTSSESLTSDAVFVSQQQEAAEPFDIKANILIKMGQNVELDIMGLTGFLDGSIDYTQTPNSSPLAVGALKIRDGKYQAYGQNLVIEEGQLFFSGGLISNPGIRVRAVRSFSSTNTNFSGSNSYFDFGSDNLQNIEFSNSTKVGIEVTGRVNAPKIKLFSTPANLSQADILSMLILGRPASQASSSGGQMLLTALTSMNLDSGTKGSQLMSQLKNNLGLDFGVQSNSTYDQAANETTDSTSFMLGKSIGKRMQFNYSVGLLQDNSNVFSLSYLLNKFFSIQVSASDTGSGIDFLYNHPKD